MRKSLLLFMLLLTSVAGVQAQRMRETAPQITKGNWMVGASLAGLGYNVDSEVFSVNVNPRVAYFVSNNVALGGQVGLGLDAYSGGSDFRYSIAPLLRGYFGTQPNQRFFAEASIGFQGTSGDTVGDSNGFGFGAAVGWTRFITQSVGLEVGVGYDYTNIEDTGLSNIGLNLGFQIYLPGRTMRAMR